MERDFGTRFVRPSPIPTAGEKLGWDIPLFMEVWHDRPEMAGDLGHGSCSHGP
jgi:hypothetical protein